MGNAGKRFVEAMKKIAESAGRISKVEAFVNEETREVTFFSLSYDGREVVVGPMKSDDLEMLLHCMNDVFQMKGRYNPID